MATTKISSTKSTSRAINYAEKRAEEKSALNCDIDYAKSSFKATRELYGKTNGNQGHVIIQSFKPDEVTPEQCNQLGLELAEKIAPNHQVAVYTHNDTDHVHNHIVINSVDLETGKKFYNNKQALKDIRQANDEISKTHNLSIPDKQAQIRYTQAEQNIMDKSEDVKASWKNQIRIAIEDTKEQAADFDEFNELLKPKGVEIARVTDKTITYKHIEEDKKVRGSKLGEDYNKEELDNGFRLEKQRRERQSERQIRPNIKATKADWDEFREENERRERERREQERRENERINAENERLRKQREQESRTTQSVNKKARGIDLEL
ncbi:MULTISPECIES: relaxase/mobilization nuclease domain-containing protein [Staphylococcus]|uniref:relaxase/mobilization nuclease domain-containing protein n=1 Tax=Bacillales TaxID=1385 RepID=UPI001CDCE04F|nr:relaxase/mobilization nuclease domain-containing protein [Staphylococcus xylosus]MCA2504055.1 relaxase/mobilization nuclease domain-containing protein [Staphylococcus xylosus]